MTTERAILQSSFSPILYYEYFVGWIISRINKAMPNHPPAFGFMGELAEIAERKAKNRIAPLVQSSDSQPNMTATETTRTKDQRTLARTNLGVFMVFTEVQPDIGILRWGSTHRWE